MAELFLAKQAGFDGFEKVVAIKRILSHLAYDDEFIAMLRDEARLVAKLNHPHIVQIYDLGKDEGSYFIAMEYIAGRNFSVIAKKSRELSLKIPPVNVARCIAQACEGLFYAYTRTDIDGKQLKIIHRDFSPQNIIVSLSGSVKLVDFGIAKAASKVAHTRPGVLKGKYAYMSPEQILGEELDARSDLFSVGIVLYELLCGRRPFEKANSILTLKAIVQEAPTPCRELNRDIPETLASIIDRCLEKDRNNRYSTAQELQIELEDFVGSSGERCNSVRISNWLEELFDDELNRVDGATVVFPGIGKVILPEIGSTGHRSLFSPADAGESSRGRDALSEARRRLRDQNPKRIVSKSESNGFVSSSARFQASDNDPDALPSGFGAMDSLEGEDSDELPQFPGDDGVEATVAMAPLSEVANGSWDVGFDDDDQELHTLAIAGLDENVEDEVASDDHSFSSIEATVAMPAVLPPNGNEDTLNADTLLPGASLSVDEPRSSLLFPPTIQNVEAPGNPTDVSLSDPFGAPSSSTDDRTRANYRPSEFEIEVEFDPTNEPESPVPPVEVKYSDDRTIAGVASDFAYLGADLEHSSNDSHPGPAPGDIFARKTPVKAPQVIPRDNETTSADKRTFGPEATEPEVAPTTRPVNEPMSFEIDFETSASDIGIETLKHQPFTSQPPPPEEPPIVPESLPAVISESNHHDEYSMLVGPNSEGADPVVAGSMDPTVPSYLAPDRNGGDSKKIPQARLLSQQLLSPAIPPKYNSEPRRKSPGPSRSSMGGSVRQIKEVIRNENTRPRPPPPPRIEDLEVGPAPVSPAAFEPMAPEPFVPIQPATAPISRLHHILNTVAMVVGVVLLASATYIALPYVFPDEPRLTIRTEPFGAEVWVNGALQSGKTPLTISGLTPGVAYRVRLTLPQHQPVEQSIELPKDRPLIWNVQFDRDR